MTAHQRLEWPAFYALRPGGWRDLVTVLHPPYTAWNLANVAIGAAVAPHLYGDRLVAVLGAFLLGVGVCAHTLDELNGRPLGTRLSRRVLVALAGVSLAGAVAIGVVGALTISLTLIPFVLAGAFIVLAYNLEWFGGRFHTAFWLAASWGAFPALTGYWVMALQLIREGGAEGLAGVRAIGVALRRGDPAERASAQVSINVERPAEVPLRVVIDAVRTHAAVACAELVGLAPAVALEGFPADLPMPSFDPARHVIENALRL